LGEINLPLADPQLRSAGGLVACGVPLRHPDARQQLAGAERLREVIVSPKIKRRDRIRVVVANREHDDRYIGRGAHTPAHLQPIKFWQAEIKQYHVVAPAICASASCPLLTSVIS
jgi:hypothetical protein